MTIPQFGGIRQSLANALGLSEALLWIPVSLLLIAGYFATQKILAISVAKPIESLAKNARDGETAGFVFQKKSALEEEDALKRFFEKQTQKVSEIEGCFDDLEKSLASADEEVANLSSQSERQAKDLAQFEESNHELRVRNQSMAAENEVLQTTLDSERRSKVGREVKMRAHEIYVQMERAVAKGAAQAIWIPNLMERLKAPTDQINELAHELESNWSRTSFDRIAGEIAKIREQSDRQCKLLEKLSTEELLAAVPEAQEILEAGDVEIGSSEPEIENSDPVKPEPNRDEAAQDVYAAIESQAESSDTPEEEEPEPAKLSLAPQNDSIEEVASEAEIEISSEDSIEAIASDNDLLQAEAEPVEIESEAIALPDASQDADPAGDAEALTALQSLVFELVRDYSQEVENVKIDADFQDPIKDIEVDEELLESVLSNLIEIAIYQWKEGSVRLRVSRKDDNITFAVESQGMPLEYGEFDETQTNRIESALDRKIDVDMPSENELRMRYKYVLEDN